MQKVNILGYDGDLDIAGPGEVWPVGGAYSFPSAAAATTIVSADAQDDSAGTGARTVRIVGLDDDLRAIEETATMDGATPVSLTNQFKRINKIEVMTAGSGGVAAGLISVKHGGTTIGVIEAGQNVSRMAIFTCPDNVRNWVLKKFNPSIQNALAGAVTFTVLSRKSASGSLWKERWSLTLYGTTKPTEVVDVPIHFEGGEDVKVYAVSTADNAVISCGLYLEGSSAPLE